MEMRSISTGIISDAHLKFGLRMIWDSREERNQNAACVESCWTPLRRERGERAREMREREK